MTTARPTRIAQDGLRYTSKPAGSPFPSAANGATMSCFKCSRHESRALGAWRLILGQKRFVCSDCAPKPRPAHASQ